MMGEAVAVICAAHTFLREILGSSEKRTHAAYQISNAADDEFLLKDQPLPAAARVGAEFPTSPSRFPPRESPAWRRKTGGHDACSLPRGRS
jgi:hypothetical protein